LLNGNIGVVKTYLGEVTDSTNQTRAWSWFSLAAGAGAVVGALAGGLLAQPARTAFPLSLSLSTTQSAPLIIWFSSLVKYPKLFSAGHGFFNGLFEEFPYLLPNVMAVLVSGLGLILSYFYLTENKIPQRPVEVETYGPLDEESEGAVLEIDDNLSTEDGMEMKVMNSPDWRMKSEIASKETEDWRKQGDDDHQRLEEEQDQKDLVTSHHEAEAVKKLQLTGEQELTLEEKVDGEGEGAFSSLRSVLRLHAPWGKNPSTSNSLFASFSSAFLTGCAPIQAM
jgi:hypothetical protein